MEQLELDQFEITDFLVETQEEDTKEVDLKQCEIIFEEKTGIRFDRYYNEYYPKLLWFLKSKCTDHFEVEDLVSESFIKALKNIHKYDPNYKFSTWLYKLSFNILRQYFKDKTRLPVSNYEDMSVVDSIEEEYTGEAQETKNKLKADIIIRKMGLLNEKQRAALMMREVEKMSYQQIADKLNINLSTIKSQIRGGRLNVIEMVKAEFEYIDEAY